MVGALCEPALVREEASARAVLAVLDGVTDSMRAAFEEERKAEDFRVLRQAPGYGRSVAIVGCPSVGRPLLEKWLQSNDTDVVLLARENLKKDRLKRMDPAWVERWTSR